MDSPERWQRVKGLFHQALAVPAAEREGFLNSLSESEPALGKEVGSLISAHLHGAAALEPPGTPGATGAAADDGLIGRTLGSFTILRLLGRGGMGSVYEARQDSPRRRVALKVVRSSGRVDQHVLKLFRREMQALALLTHPNIAGLFEAGHTNDGRHYFAMELVDGLPLTEYVQRRQCSIEQKLELFSRVCVAVAFAHQRGVIHRDIKPSNILVLDDAVESRSGAAVRARAIPKLLDFGLAKITESDIALTTFSQDTGRIQGTLAYMSPEQARGQSDSIDTRSDIYSLGVVMYELMTGRLPYDIRMAPLPHAVRLICDESPTRPSSIHKSLRGDLETIVLKALEKDPQQRYQSVTELAADVQRYLAGDTIMARPHSVAHHLRKAVRRHKLAFGIAVVSALSLLGLAIAMTVQSFRIAHQRDRAERAEAAATERLWQSYLSQARAHRVSGHAGQRLEALRAIRHAAEIRPSPELRNEAIAAMASYDVQPKHNYANAKTYFRFEMADNGERYVCEDRKGEILVCNAADDRLIFRIAPDEVPCDGLRLSPCGRFLAGTDYRPGNYISPRIRIWDIDRQRLMTELRDPLSSLSTCFYLASDRLISAHPDGTIRIRMLPAASEISRISNAPSHPFISLSRDGTTLAIAGNSEKTIELWRIHPPERIAHFSMPGNTFFGPAFSSDGRFLASGCSDRNVYVWEIGSGRMQAVLRGHEWFGVSVCFANSGHLLMSASWDGTSRLWDIWSQRELLNITGGLTAPKFGADDTTVYFHQGRRSGAYCVAMELINPSECQAFGAGTPLNASASTLQIDSGTGLMTASSPEGVTLWNIATKEKLLALPIGATYAASIQPGVESMVTSGSMGLYRWPIERVSMSPLDPAAPSEAMRRLKLGPPQALSELREFREAVLSADGDTLAALHPSSREVLVFNLTGALPVRRIALDLLGNCYMALSADGRWLATSFHHDVGIKVWDARTGKHVENLDFAGVGESSAIEFSRDGRCLFAINADEFAFWECGSFECIRRKSLLDSPTTATEGLQKSPDGSQVLGPFRLIDPVSMEEVAVLNSRLIGGGGRLTPLNGWIVQSDAMHSRFQLWDLRRVRANLAEMGLDWDAPAYSPLPDDFGQPIEIEVDLGSQRAANQQSEQRECAPGSNPTLEGQPVTPADMQAAQASLAPK